MHEVNPVPAVQDVVLPEEMTGGVDFAHNSSNTVRTIHRLTVAGATVVALAGCSTSGCESVADGGKNDTNQSDASGATQAERSLAQYRWSASLTGEKPDIEEAKKFTVTLTGDNKKLGGSVQRAMDAAAARRALTDAQLSPTSDDGKFIDRSGSVKIITDERIRESTATGIYVYESDEVLTRFSSIGNNDYTLEQARDDIEGRMPAGGEAVKAEALKGIDGLHGKAIVDTFEKDEDEDAARAALGEIRDPGLRAIAEKGIDIEDAHEALADLALEGATASEVREDLANVKDSNIRRKALAAVQAAQSDEYAIYDPMSDIELMAGDVNDALYSYESPFEKRKDTISEYKNTLGSMLFDAKGEVDQHLDKAFANENAVTPKKLRTLPPLANPGNTIDLTDVEAKETITNHAYDFMDADDYRPKEFGQLGEVYAKNGELVFDLQTGGGLSEEARRGMQAAFNRARPVLEAAFASGELVRVHYVLSGDYTGGPFYSGQTREMYLVLDSNSDYTSVDQLASTTVHEGNHAWSRDTFGSYTLSPKEIGKLESACNVLKGTAYRDMELTLSLHPEILENLRDAAQDKHKPIFDVLIKAVDKGNLAEILMLKPEEIYGSSLSDNECLDVGNSAKLITRAATRAKVEFKADNELDYLSGTEYWTKFATEWDNMMEYSSVYEKFNESAFIETNDPKKYYIGHSEEKAVEAHASITNAVLSYPDKFEAALVEMDTDERKAVLKLLEWCVADMMRDPNLKDAAIGIRQRYLSK